MMEKLDLKNPVTRWIDQRLPVFSYMHAEYGVFPMPRNLNYFWSFGALAMISLVVMILTGILLAMQYTANVDMAFMSVERIMRDINYGWLLRYIHMNGASMFFIVVYIHIFRGLYFGSYKYPRELLWILGVLILVLMMATAFMGYVLPWGQMSFWGATVITQLFSAFPIIGEPIVEWLWGGLSVDNPTLNRFFALHFLMPFVIVGVVILHVIALHIAKSNNPTGVEARLKGDTVTFHPYFTAKDMVAVAVFALVFAFFVFFAPNYMGHPDNYIEANPMVTPAHIVPEWYFLPYYAILRSFTDDFWLYSWFLSWAMTSKLAGVLAMFGALLVLAMLPWFDTSPVKSARYRPVYKWFVFLFVFNVFLLGYCGGKPAEGWYVVISQWATIYYFAHFLVITPLVGWLERPKTLPNSISEAILEQSQQKSAKSKAKVTTAALIALFLGAGALTLGSHSAQAAGDVVHPPKQDWDFTGFLGKYDRATLQRGLQVHMEVCASCHGLSLINFRNLSDLGYNEAQIKAIAANYEVQGEPDSFGDPTMRTAIAADAFPDPYPNENAARASNGGAYPPDLSLIVKSRNHANSSWYGIFPNFVEAVKGRGFANGTDYVAALLSGYQEPPEDFTVMDGMYYNPYYPGGQFAMPQPLYEDSVEYADGTPATIEQMSNDVAVFLSWAAEPAFEARKALGIKVIAFLAIFLVVLIMVKKSVWRNVEH
ncbi:MAG: cytochrome c1 [Alphaproteobacteria bacterium]